MWLPLCARHQGPSRSTRHPPCSGPDGIGNIATQPPRTATLATASGTQSESHALAHVMWPWPNYSLHHHVMWPWPNYSLRRFDQTQSCPDGRADRKAQLEHCPWFLATSQTETTSLLRLICIVLYQCAYDKNKHVDMPQPILVPSPLESHEARSGHQSPRGTLSG